MKKAQAVLAVKFQSSLRPESLLRRCLDGLEDFRSVPGLVQKYYLTEDSTGAISGIYLFEDKEALEAFWGSEVAQSIPPKYGVIPETLRVEKYELAIVLNEGVEA